MAKIRLFEMLSLKNMGISKSLYLMILITLIPLSSLTLFYVYENDSNTKNLNRTYQLYHLSSDQNLKNLELLSMVSDAIESGNYNYKITSMLSSIIYINHQLQSLKTHEKLKKLTLSFKILIINFKTIPIQKHLFHLNH